MKNLITSLAIILFAGVQLQATALPENNLTQRIWTSETDKTGFYLEFYDHSIVDIFQVNEAGNVQWTSYMWSIEEKEGSTLLHIQPKIGMKSMVFTYEPGTGKFIAKNTAANQLKVQEIRPVTAGIITEDQILGKWKSPFYDLQTREKVMNPKSLDQLWKTGFEFSADGTFTQHCQVGRTLEEETGVWSLSKDGQFLKLQYTKDGNVEKVYRKDIIQLKSFDGEHLHLKTSLRPDRAGRDMAEYHLKKKGSIRS